MIPWKLRFRGIRDYETIVLDLSAENDHVLISGPNGAGKSTITFCMGAVLGSGKVDIEGLKSNNIPTNQVWRATIELLFKNAGKVKVDAPEFVQFRLEIEQNPGDPVRKEFYIEEGDLMDDWERTTKFSSGGQLNLTEYKNQILYKYAVDPDAFYLIWYQKEVNQFAIMAAEERFRIFSEMNGIDQIQKNWEESKELVKETEQSLAEVESIQKINKLNLKASKQALDAYLDRNRRREEGFRKYHRALTWLKVYYLDQISKLKEQIEELEADKEEQIDLKHKLGVALDDKKEEFELFSNHIKEMEVEVENLDSNLTQIGKKLEGEKERKDAIADEIAEISNQVAQIGLSEEKVKENLVTAKKNYHRTDTTIKELIEKQMTLRKRYHILLDDRAEFNVQIRLDSEKEKQYKQMIAEYKSSNAVQQELNKNNHVIGLKKDQLRTSQEKQKEMEKELSFLKQNKVYSPRQEVSIRYFKKQNIEVYPLRELLELDANAGEKDELLFDTIKYTLFVNKKKFHAPNDLYHVALPNIVPEKSIMHLPDKHVQVKRQLEEKLYPFAIKALWWVDTFFTEEKPKVTDGLLIDNRGVRGPQEDKRIILSDKVLRVRKENLMKELARAEGEQNELVQNIERLEKRNQVLFSRRESLREAEAFFTQENERDWRKIQFEKLNQEKNLIENEIEQLEVTLNKQRELLADWNQRLEVANKNLAIYERYQKEKEKIREVQRIEKLLNELQESYNEKDKLYNSISLEIDKQKRKETSMTRRIDDLNKRYEDKAREIEQINLQIKQRNEERFTNEEGFARTDRELRNLLEEAKMLVDKYQKNEGKMDETDKSAKPQSLDEQKLTKPQADELRERGKAAYEIAKSQTDIDEAAPENYSKMKEEYDRSEDEVKKSRLLLEEYSERMEKSKEELENTINTKIIVVNQKFVNYMSQFGFEGKIEWEMYTDRNGQSRYRLFIKARKEGHRGKMEDVNEKARGGKVGKGVSGGEESLSSLLFALALLQTIETTPGYIVLDEFDSALDEGRKEKVFQLYEQELNRKMIILTPKSHEEEYLYRFSKAYVVHHDPNIPKSTVFKVKRVEAKVKDLV